MQKQKIDPTYLTLHSDYNSVFCGLFKGDACVALAQEHKLTASKNLMVRLTTLLEDQGVSWADLSFIAVNQGPSPFTTLRVVITTVNGLLFAKKIPLVGVDGLRAFLSEYNTTPSDITVTLLNAFNKDIYFGIKYPDGSTETGWGFYATYLDELHAKLHKEYPKAAVTFVGNGTDMHQETIMNLFPNAHIPDPLPETASIYAIAACALAQWKLGEATNTPVLPLYLKTMDYKPST